MTLKLYDIDRRAHDLVLQFRDKKDKDVLGESHKMRMMTAYGLERFWGEHLRLLQRESQDKADFWKATWTEFCKIMKDAGITIPNDRINPNDSNAIKTMADKLWDLGISKKQVNPSSPNATPANTDETSNDDLNESNYQRKIALTVLTELCDSMVWWTQRYKKPRNTTGGSTDGRAR